MKMTFKAFVVAIMTLVTPLMLSAGEPKSKTMAHSMAVDVNTASEAQLMTLPGIGESKAKAIIAYRNEHGPFRDLNELQNVKGIGSKMVAKLDGKVTFKAPLARVKETY